MARSKHRKDDWDRPERRRGWKDQQRGRARKGEPPPPPAPPPLRGIEVPNRALVPLPPPRDQEEYGAGLLAPLSSYAGEGSGVRLTTTTSAVAHTCGRCAEWLADPEGGRGECLHPGSGILRPWWDTPACPFFH